MSGVVIKVENLTKEYRLGVINHGTLAKDFQTWWARKRGKDDPNSPVTRHPSPVTRHPSPVTRHPSPDEIYALKDINFEVRQGEVLGIIGANGAGKSTLLKILSRVTSPTSGCVKIKGRIGSLLEVCTGFHPELTGRENIYLNGAILGMKKWEITRKLDEIIDFSGVERFIDTPVKRYSSGMYVRLAFAVAAHLDPEILVIDEVLAVGDAEFQKKCLGKMGDISKKEGRTVLFVSHNMAAVRQLCDRGVFLKRGMSLAQGEIDNIVDEYLSFDEKLIETDLTNRLNREGSQIVKFTKFEVLSGNKLASYIKTGQEIAFRLSLNSPTDFFDVRLDLTVYNHFGNKIVHTNTFATSKRKINLKKGVNFFVCSFPEMPLQVGSYYVNVAVFIDGKMSDWLDKVAVFNVKENDVFGTGKLPHKNSGEVILFNSWNIEDSK